jgi:hypothetical protein
MVLRLLGVFFFECFAQIVGVLRLFVGVKGGTILLVFVSGPTKT